MAFKQNFSLFMSAHERLLSMVLKFCLNPLLSECHFVMAISSNGLAIILVGTPMD